MPTSKSILTRYNYIDYLFEEFVRASTRDIRFQTTKMRTDIQVKSFSNIKIQTYNTIDNIIGLVNK